MRTTILAAATAALLLPAFTATPAHARCQEPDEVLRLMDFTTVVLGAHKRTAIGVNGYYRIVISRKSCKLEASIAKLGFTNTMFSQEKIQRGTFPAASYTVPSLQNSAGEGNDVYFVDADLDAVSGSKLSMAFTFVGGMGFWRYVGDSWRSTGMWGALRSVDLPRAGAAVRGPFLGAREMTCKSHTVRAPSSVAVGFECDDLIVATPELDRALFAAYSQAEGGILFTKVAASSGAYGIGRLEICTDWMRDSYAKGDMRDVIRLNILGGRVTESRRVTPRSARICGVKPPPKAKPRWTGGVE